MNSKIRGKRVAIIGGDRRQQVLINQLVQMGVIIHVVGLPVDLHQQVREYTTIHEAIQGVDAILLPMPGVNDDGKVHAPFSKATLLLTPELVQKIPVNTPIFVGVAKPYLKQLLMDHRLLEIAEMDDVAIPNSIPSAEGAIQIAMEQLPITIHGSHAYVLGFGRVGVTLARMLAGIGAQVTVVARKTKDLARIEEIGYQPLEFSELMNQLSQADIIFNTVPEMVLDSQVLQMVRREALIVDLASTPGGTDFKAAANLGINAILAPGLPGKVAPLSAGLILAQVIPKLLEQELGL